MTAYYRVMLGRQSMYAQQCLDGGFIGVDFDIHRDLSGSLPDKWREFNQAVIPEFMAAVPGKTKIAAGLACGMLWTVSKGINLGDIVLCPDGSGSYLVGRVTGDYHYAEGQDLPHRRMVQWQSMRIARADMSEALRRSTASSGTTVYLGTHAVEIEGLLGSSVMVHGLVESIPDVEDPLAFALEKHLEDFLVANWNSTLLAADFNIVEEDGALLGQQYQTDAGVIDILAVSKDGTRLLVVELKRGRASDVVVGQVLRYMGFVQEQLAEPNQTVEGVVIAFDDDDKMRWALVAAPSVKFYRYEVNFKLIG